MGEGGGLRRFWGGLGTTAILAMVGDYGILGKVACFDQMSFRRLRHVLVVRACVLVVPEKRLRKRLVWFFLGGVFVGSLSGQVCVCVCVFFSGGGMP